MSALPQIGRNEPIESVILCGFRGAGDSQMLAQVIAAGLARYVPPANRLG